MVSVSAGSMRSPAASAGPVIATRSSDSVIGPTTNCPPCSALTSSGTAAHRSQKSPRTAITTSAGGSRPEPTGWVAAEHSA